MSSNMAPNNFTCKWHFLQSSIHNPPMWFFRKLLLDLVRASPNASPPQKKHEALLRYYLPSSPYWGRISPYLPMMHSSWQNWNWGLRLWVWTNSPGYTPWVVSVWARRGSPGLSAHQKCWQNRGTKKCQKKQLMLGLRKQMCWMEGIRHTYLGIKSFGTHGLDPHVKSKYRRTDVSESII